ICIRNSACACVAEATDCNGMPNGTALPGTACNDGNANTGNDTWNNNCQCAGTPVALDCNGVPNGPALPGTACNDGNANTGNDTWNNNCQCTGQPLDCNGEPGGAAELDDCGICAGGSTGLVPNADSDGDSVLDCMDSCPGMADADQADFDGDGIGDVCDNCTWMYNPDQADTNGDGIGDACQFGFLTGVGEMAAVDQGLSVWPNPAIGKVVVRCKAGVAAYIRLHDLAGRMVDESSWREQLDLSNLPAGTYLISACDQAGLVMASTKLVKL
ncbi:MAG: T9SS type A sorting domain-containing protein, partial [Flavobacteriales bacterium]|nr:T9SS type A sorting domain-containing protein [Flavobacteriales bacterium]